MGYIPLYLRSCGQFPDAFFQVSRQPYCRLFIGTLVLATISVLAGELSVAVAYRFNKEKMVDTCNEIDHFHNLSVKALKIGNKDAFKACNCIANESYGKSFFEQAALVASFLWPAFIALGWMEYRFSNIEFNLPFSVLSDRLSIGYISTYVLCYVCARTIINRTKKIKNYF